MSTLPTRIYLDYNATQPLLPRAKSAMADAADAWGNPSSLHAEGRAARGIIERSRSDVAALIGGDRYGVIFTSGGTESDQLGIVGLAGVATKAGRPRVVATTAIEHPAVIGAVEELQLRGWRVNYIPLDPAGAIDLVAYAAMAPELGLCAISAVNHEVGTVQNIAEIGRITKAAGAYLHVDAVQAAGRVDMAAWLTTTDALAISAHKVGGPKGVAALWLNAARAGVDHALPVIVGGHQERGRRSGTENTSAIAGFAAAAQHAIAMLPAWDAVAQKSAALERGLAQITGVTITAASGARVGGTVNAIFDGARGESLVMALDIASVSVSTGAACTSGSVKPSAVLLGLGMDEQRARSAVRFSLGHATTSDEIAHVIGLLPNIVQRARTAYRR
jgi:cysteine desulfurase